MKKEEILQVLPERLRQLVKETVTDWDALQEIHIRLGRGIVFTIRGKKTVPHQDGQVVTKKEFREILEYISNYSLYAFVF